MANHYCMFSFNVPVPESQRGWLKELLDIIEEFNGEEVEEGNLLLSVFPDWNEYQSADFDFSFGDGNLWLYAEESGNTENAATLVKALMQRAHDDQQQSLDFVGAEVELKQVAFTWASTCSRPRYNEFFGGACHIFMNGGTAETEWMDSYSWMQERTEEYMVANAQRKRG